ncbi:MULTISPECIES: hypothetical protein [unclassified Nonomuraea]|uniref:hypothetical protein n=1 Tax=unclassified Nonomuraea TaxID=2593643 RepID=UPI0033F43B1C
MIEPSRAATGAGLLTDETETRLLIAQATTDLLRPSPDGTLAWIDFEIRAADSARSGCAAKAEQAQDATDRLSTRFTGQVMKSSDR